MRDYISKQFFRLTIAEFIGRIVTQSISECVFVATKINICESNQLFVINFDCSVFVNKISCLFSNILGSNLCTHSENLQTRRWKFASEICQKNSQKLPWQGKIRAHNLTINMFEKSTKNYWKYFHKQNY